MKEEKKEQKKNAKDDKKKSKTKETPAEIEAEEGKPSQRGKRPSKALDEKPASKAKAKAKPRAQAKGAAKSAAKAKAKGKAKSKAKPEPELEESEEEEQEDEESEEEEQEDEVPVEEPPKVPKGRASKAKAKPEPKKASGPKPKAKTKKDKDEDQAKAKPKASRKRKSQTEAEMEDKEEQEDEEEEAMVTPKKKLFDGEADEQDGTPHYRVDSKSQAVKPLQQIFEEDKPQEWAKSRPKKAQRTHRSLAPENDVEEMEEDKPGKKKGRGKKKAELSPFAKKENARRKKKETAAMQQTPQEDAQAMAIFKHHMKQCLSKDATSLKEYLYQNLDHKFKNGRLNPYFKRPACGAQYALDDNNMSKLSEIVYFGRCGTAKTYNVETVAVFVQGSLMVSWLICSNVPFANTLSEKHHSPSSCPHLEMNFFYVIFCAL